MKVWAAVYVWVLLTYTIRHTTTALSASVRTSRVTSKASISASASASTRDRARSIEESDAPATATGAGARGSSSARRSPRTKRGTPLPSEDGTGLVQNQNRDGLSEDAGDEGPKTGPRSGRSPRSSTDRVRSSEVTETVTRAENGVGSSSSSSSRRLRERSQTNTSRGGHADGPKGAASRGGSAGPKAGRAGAGSRGSGSRRSSPRSARESNPRVRPAFDAAALVNAQTPNEDANPYQLLHPTHHPTTVTTTLTPPITTHFQTASLEELFGCGISERFAGDAQFRNELRDAMRYDVFHSTPSYATLGEKAMQMMLHPDSSLQGSWFCGSTPDNQMTRLEQESLTQEAILLDVNIPSPTQEDTQPRMTRLTKVLSTHLGSHAPSGDEFLTTIGALCGPHPSGHWIDIVGIQNRQISHSWHQDTGLSLGGTSQTVMLGFPPTDGYEGPGVFSHVVKLDREHVRATQASGLVGGGGGSGGAELPREPILFPHDTIGEEFIVRPVYAPGRELLMFRDVDCIHSAPDVTYRTSVMRFM